MPTERNEYQQAAFESGKKAMDSFLSNSHGTGYAKDMIQGMIQSFVHEHRTIQQESVRFFVQFLVEWAKNPKSHIVDLRNEATYDFAKKLSENEPLFPYI